MLYLLHDSTITLIMPAVVNMNIIALCNSWLGPVCSFPFHPPIGKLCSEYPKISPNAYILPPIHYFSGIEISVYWNVYSTSIAPFQNGACGKSMIGIEPPYEMSQFCSTTMGYCYWAPTLQTYLPDRNKNFPQPVFITDIILVFSYIMIDRASECSSGTRFISTQQKVTAHDRDYVMDHATERSLVSSYFRPLHL